MHTIIHCIGKKYMTEQSLVPSAGLTSKMRTEYSACRKDLETSSQHISEYIRTHTHKERQALEAALAALDRKQRELNKSAAVQEQRRQQQAALQRLEDVTDKIDKMHRKALRQIQAMDVSMEQKRDLWRQVQEGINTIMHSDDELKAMKEFKAQFKAMIGGGGAPLLLLG